MINITLTPLIIQEIRTRQLTPVNKRISTKNALTISLKEWHNISKCSCKLTYCPKRR